MPDDLRGRGAGQGRGAEAGAPGRLPPTAFGATAPQGQVVSGGRAAKGEGARLVYELLAGGPRRSCELRAELVAAGLDRGQAARALESAIRSRLVAEEGTLLRRGAPTTAPDPLPELEDVGILRRRAVAAELALQRAEALLEKPIRLTEAELRARVATLDYAAQIERDLVVLRDQLPLDLRGEERDRLISGRREELNKLRAFALEVRR